MRNWMEIKTAYYVAKAGTISKASEMLSCQRSTIIRHIDKLEREIGEKLFVRHLRGYTPTEFGQELLSVAESANQNFERLSNSVNRKSAILTGELIISSMEINGILLQPLIMAFQRENPSLVVRYVEDEKQAVNLDYGEAHISIVTTEVQAGPDSIEQPIFTYQFGLYAHKDYIAEKGMPNSFEDYPRHRFVCSNDKEHPAVFLRWLQNKVPPERFSFISHHPPALARGVELGFGIGFVPVVWAKRNPLLTEVHAPLPEWDVHFKLVTHYDVHRSRKVQAFLDFIKKPDNQPLEFSELSKLRPSMAMT